MTTKRGPVIAGLVLFALAIAGCGGQQFPTTAGGTSSPPVTARARLLAAVTRTTEAKTAKLAIDMSMSGTGNAGSVHVSGSGAMDLTRRRIEMKMASAGATPLSVEMRLVDGTVYLNTGTGWTSQSATSTGPTTPMPTNYLEYLRGIGSTVRVEGTEAVRGVYTTRYGTTVDLGRAAAHAGTPEQKAALQKLLGQIHFPAIPLTAWIDDAGRLRRMRMVMDLGSVTQKLGAPAGVDLKIDMTFELYDFGAPVSVTAPAGAVPYVAPVDATPLVRAAEVDLRNALTAEKVAFIDGQEYSADVSVLRQIEPSLDWGGKVTVVVGSGSGGPNSVVCVSEHASSSTTPAIADVGSGPHASTYFGLHGCPVRVTDVTVSRLGATG